MNLARKIPVWDIPCCSGMIMEDVLSQKGALLLPKGTSLSKMGDSRLSLAHSLADQGVRYVTVREDVEFILSEIFEVLDAMEVPSNPVDRRLTLQTIQEIRRNFSAIASGEVSQVCLVPLLRIGRLLALTITNNPRILLSLSNVREQDQYTFVHSFNVALLGGFLAYRLAPENNSLVEAVTTGGLLHDLGKARLPLSILNKPSRLTEKEFDEVKKHPIYGASIAKQLGVDDKDILAVIEGHHERVDGTGYPYHLCGAHIPLPARIAAVADVFDALTTVRLYKESVPLHRAISIIIENAEYHFDKAVVSAFLGAVGIYPPGTVVQLSDNRMGIVIAAGEKSILRPRVLLKTDEEGERYEEHVVLDLSSAPHLFVRSALDDVGKRKDSVILREFH